MLFETKQKKKFRKKTDRQGHVSLEALWQSVDMDELVLPKNDHLSMTVPAFKKQANLFVRRLSRAGAFQKFSMAQQVNAQHGWAPKGYEVALKLPLHCGGNYHISNLILLPQGYSSILYDLYLRQVADEIAVLSKGKKLSLTLPHWPDFITPENFKEILFPEDRKQVADFLKVQKIRHMDSSQKVQRIEEGKKLIFRLKKVPSFPFAVHDELKRVSFLNLVEREEIARHYSKEKSTLFLQALKRGDFDFLASKDKERLMKTHQLSPELKLTCHHILPRQLGGKNDVDNVVWMGEKDHQKLHQEALNFLVDAVLTQSNKDSSKEIYIALLVPEKIPSRVKLKKSPVTYMKNGRLES